MLSPLVVVMIYHYTILLLFSEHLLQFFWSHFTFFIVIVHVFSTAFEFGLLLLDILYRKKEILFIFHGSGYNK